MGTGKRVEAATVDAGPIIHLAEIGTKLHEVSSLFVTRAIVDLAIDQLHGQTDPTWPGESVTGIRR